MKFRVLTLAMLAAAAAFPASATEYWFRQGGTSKVTALSASVSGSETARLGSKPTLRMTPLGSATAYVWSWEGTLPPGLTFSGGVFSGAATSLGKYPLTLVAKDPAGPENARKAVEIKVVAPVTVAGPTTILSRVGQPVPANSFSASGLLGTATLSSVGQLPAGVTFSGASFSGSATNPFDGRPSVVARDDADGAEGTASVTMAVRAMPSVRAGQSVNAATNANLSVALTAQDVVGTASWTAPNGLPAGLSLSAGGVVSGTPSAVSSGSFDVRVVDSIDGAASAVAQVSYNFEAPTCSFNGTTLREGQTVTTYQYSDRSCGNTEVRACRNGSLSGTYANSSCVVALRWTFSHGGSMGMQGINSSCPTGACSASERGNMVTCNMRSAGTWPMSWNFDWYVCQ